MRSLKNLIRALACCAALYCGKAAADSNMHLEGDINYVSTFVGKDGPVLIDGPAMQPHLNLRLETALDIAIDLWGNYDVEGNDFTEMDTTVDCTYEVVDGLSGSVGYTSLYFPSGFARNTQEVYAGVRYVNDIVNSSLLTYYDFVDGDGLLALLRLDHPFQIVDGKVKITPSIAVGYNDGYFRDGNGFSHMQVGVDASAAVTDYLMVSTFLTQQLALSPDYDDVTLGGLKLTLEGDL